MADLVRLAYYPFLPEVRDAVRELGPDIQQVLRSPIYEGVRRRAVQRIEGAFTDRAVATVAVTDERGAMQELLSVPLARMLAVLLGDRILMQRYAQAEGVRLEKVLAQDPAGLPETAAALGVAAQPHEMGWRLHFSDYLRLAPGHESEWKLIMRPVDKGWVPLSAQSLARLCREALEKRIAAELEEERKHPIHGDVLDALQPYVDELAPKLAEAREQWSTGEFGPVKKELFPPCILDIFGQMKDGKMVAHHARFAMASFLATIGMTVDDIMDYFREIPNFDPEKSRYQIEHIAGDRSVEKYTPPGCATMQTHGICPLDKRDNLCFKVKHPLSYYRARLRFQAEDEERAKHMIAAKQRKNREEANGTLAAAASDRAGEVQNA